LEHFRNIISYDWKKERKGRIREVRTGASRGRKDGDV
jgi:hypothetical protein